MPKPRYITRLEQIPQLSSQEARQLQVVVDKFAFRTNDYYQSLIDWNNPNDPIHRIVVPDIFELSAWGELDASNEEQFTVAPGCQHKYMDTALFLVNDVCGAYCRFCFRKRLFMNENDEVGRDLTEAVEYVRSQPRINNVLLTGGDPLLLSTNRLGRLIRRLREIEHVHVIRIGTKMPAFNPFRISEDAPLLEMLSENSLPSRKIYLIAHFNHPRELTSDAIHAMNLIQRAGVVTANQTPLLRGINDDPTVLSQLLNKCAFNGIAPYYVFQCRPTAGNFTFSTPIERSIEIFDFARLGCSGLARWARLAMSHHTGKVEIIGKCPERVYFKYHRSYDPRLYGHFFSCHHDPNAYWLDDYEDFRMGEDLVAAEHQAVND